MKNFANCTPDEFMAQVVKFREPFIQWVKNTGIEEIRKRRPEGYDDMSDEDKATAIRKMATENMGEMLMNAMEKSPEETREILCLATFTNKKDFNKHTMVEYIAAVLEMLGSNEVRGFFMYYLAPRIKTFSKD